MTRKGQITRLTVEGFRSIKAVRELEFGPLNLLIGANGAGKSNLIELFNLISVLTRGRLQRYVAEKGGAENLLHFGQRITPQIKIEVEFAPNSYSCVLAPDDEDALYFEAEECTFWGKKKDHPRPYSNNLGGGHRESHLSHEVWSTPVSRTVVEKMKAWTVFHFHDTSSSSPMRKPARLDDNLALHDDGGNLAAILYDLQESDRVRYQQIRDVVRFAAPFFDDFVLKPGKERNDMVALRWRHIDSQRVFGVNDLSDGTLRFITLAVLLNQGDPPDVMILDEPELGLHPAAIGLLADTMKSAATHQQIIVATQSVTLIDQFGAEEIVVAERDGNASQFRRLERNDLRDWLQDYGIGELWLKNVLGGRP
jgi:predicted ATPase